MPTPTILTDVSLRGYSTLRAGGNAERFAVARNADELAVLVEGAHRSGEPLTVIGQGSNILPSDAGIPGLTVLNLCRELILDGGNVECESGLRLQELFLKTVQAGRRGFEYAVGIPGTVGGALVSNAGAYRSNISEFLTELEVVHAGDRQWVKPEWMEFGYRTSRLRARPNDPTVVLRSRFVLPVGDAKTSYDNAREYQRQRISKQPPGASAGSFFKNVEDPDIAGSLPDLPPALKKAGVVPAGFLLEAVEMKGYRHGGAMFSARHANFLLNVGNARATELRELTDIAKARVRSVFGVELEAEVLFIGDWSNYPTS